MLARAAVLLLLLLLLLLWLLQQLRLLLLLLLPLPWGRLGAGPLRVRLLAPLRRLLCSGG